MGCPFFAPRLLRSRLLPKCQILLTRVAICGIIMVEECALMRRQTTRGGASMRRAPKLLYVWSSRKQEQDMIRQQEPDYCQILTYSQIRLHAHAAGQYPSRLLIWLHPAGRLLIRTTLDYYMRACSRTKDRVAARLRYVSHKQQEDNVYAAASKLQFNI